MQAQSSEILLKQEQLKIEENRETLRLHAATSPTVRLDTMEHLLYGDALDPEKKERRDEKTSDGSPRLGGHI